MLLPTVTLPIHTPHYAYYEDAPRPYSAFHYMPLRAHDAGATLYYYATPLPFFARMPPHISDTLR